MFAIRSPISMRHFSALIKSMEKHEVVPDVIDEAPKEVCEVVFPSGAKVDLGNVLTPTQAKDIPTVKWPATNSAFYILSVSNPDAPDRKTPTLKEWKHWLVGNIPGADVSKGDTLAEYIGAGPPKGSGLHRYVYLIYKQQDKINFDEPKLKNTSIDNRSGFSIKKFAAKYKLGSPIAGNFYLAEWDDYVVKLFKQVGLKHT